MERREALEILGLRLEELDDGALRTAYWAKAKEMHAQGGDLSSLNVARDVLEEEIARRRLPAVVDANSALVAIVKSQSRTIQEQAASEKLSAGVRSAFVKITHQDRAHREMAALLGALCGAMAFAISNVNLTEVLGESVMTSAVQLGLWFMAGGCGLAAFVAHRQIERVESRRDDVLRQIRRVSTRQQITGRVFRFEREFGPGEFRHYLREELKRVFTENHIGGAELLAEQLAGDVEDYLVDAGEVTVVIDEWGDPKFSRALPDDSRSS